MRRLILLRHGEAERRALGGGDLDRRLTQQGAADAAAAGRALAARGLNPTVALVSIATRTVETWEAAAPAFPNAQPQFQRAIYDAESTRLWELFGAAGAGTVILVGHNPGIHNLAASLAQRADGPEAMRIVRDFPPAAAAVFRIEAGSVYVEAVLFPGDPTLAEFQEPA
jgi:phosphohistidine phosphatase